MAEKPLGKALEAAMEPALNIANPPARSIGKFFGDTLDFWFSNRELKYAKKRIMDEVALRKFREECEAEFAKIPEEDLVPPRKALLFPALDAAEYYVEEDELRIMFARLIAACCDERKASRVHPSFAITIQQLSPLDAQNLRRFIYKKDGLFFDSPIPVFSLSDSFCYSFDLTTHDDDEWQLTTASIAVLEKIGLIDIRELHNSPEKGSWYQQHEARLSTFGMDFLDICLLPQEATP